MTIYRLDDDTYEIDLGLDVLTVRVDYEFRHHRDHTFSLNRFDALLENGQAANLDTETRTRLIDAVETHYIDHLWTHDEADYSDGW